MQTLIVLTGKRDGGTQDVLGFYSPAQLTLAVSHAEDYLRQAGESRRAIVRIEVYNPNGSDPYTEK